MPFDGYVTPNSKLAALADLLRHSEKWPADFKWDYGSCETCAVGLYVATMAKHRHPRNDFWDILDYDFGMSHSISGRNIFSCGTAGINPNGIADAIDTYLATRVA